MPLMCIQCAMEAILRDEEYRPTDETIEAHAARVHPDPLATAIRRQALEPLVEQHLKEKGLI